MQEILSDEIDDEEFLEFAIDNLEELSSYIINGNVEESTCGVDVVKKSK